jgi:hypothetical protein
MRIASFVYCISTAAALSTIPVVTKKPSRFLLLGGAGRIGTAAASHLLLRDPSSQIILVGRSNDGSRAVEEVRMDHPNATVSYEQVADIWEGEGPSVDRLKSLMRESDCIIHTAGPYLHRKPTPMKLAIESRCQVYVDVSDPLPYLETACLMNHTSVTTTCLLSAGAFPGMSNVMAMEAASYLGGESVHDVRFQYFTAGLGGSGPLNLYITNLGFGEPMVQYDGGQLRFFTALSGSLLGKVNFFLNNASRSIGTSGFGNEQARQRVGSQPVFAWPFPEAATVATELRARGGSIAAMGTAPGIWNTMLAILVKLIPRPWWRNETFSKFLADFSEPMVWATDKILRASDPAGVGETHAMRVDVSGRRGPHISIVQAHDSFRQCVGQSCAEFALDCLRYPAVGVELPEHRYRDPIARARIIGRLTSTPGTFCYSGPAVVEEAEGPTNLQQAIYEAEMRETQQ